MSMQISVGDDNDDETSQEVDRDDDRDDDDGLDRGSRKADRGGDRQDARDDEDDDSDDDKSPEELRDEVKRLRAALQKSNSTGQRRRQQLKDLRAAQAAVDESDDDSDDEDDTAKPKAAQGLDARAVQRMVDKARKEERKAADEQHRRDIIDTRVESALISRGVDPKGVRLLLREVDYEDLDLLKDRSVDGLDEEMDRLQTEYPAMFRRGKASSRRINGGDDREAGGRRKAPMTATERQVAQLERAKRS